MRSTTDQLICDQGVRVCAPPRDTISRGVGAVEGHQWLCVTEGVDGRQQLFGSGAQSLGEFTDVAGGQRADLLGVEGR